MSKREGNPKIPNNAPEAKKPKLDGEPLRNPEQFENVAPQQRPNSPVAGPSSASSDPELRMPLHSGLIPMYRYFNPTVQDGSSQDSSFIDIDIRPSTSSTDTTNSTNVEVGDSGTTSVEDMDVDSDATTSESSTSTECQDPRYRTHKSRRDQ